MPLHGEWKQLAPFGDRGPLAPDLDSLRLLPKEARRIAHGRRLAHFPIDRVDHCLLISNLHMRIDHQVEVASLREAELERGGVGRVAGFGGLFWRQLQHLEADVAELLRRIDVEALASGIENLAGQRFKIALDRQSALFEVRRVDGDARGLHADDDRGRGQHRRHATDAFDER